MALTAAQVDFLVNTLGLDSRRLAEAERAQDILETFGEAQLHFGGAQSEAPDSTFDPDLDEPGRIPELTPGPDPVRWDVPLDRIRSTQKLASSSMSDGRPIDDVSRQMREDGRYGSDGSPDTVLNEDATVATVDHRRLVAAEGAGIEEVESIVHAPDEALPEEMAGRFTLRQKFTDPETGTTYAKGAEAETWGEAAKFRAANQGADFPTQGSSRLPDLTDPQADHVLAEPDEPGLSERADAARQQWRAEHPEAAQSFQDQFEPDGVDAVERSVAEGPESAQVGADTPSLDSPAQGPADPATQAPVQSDAAPAEEPPPADATAPEGEGMGSTGGALLGAGIAAGTQAYEDYQKVKRGDMTVGDAAADVGEKAALTGGLTYAGSAAAKSVLTGAGADAAAAGAGSEAAAGAAAAGAEGGAGAALGAVAAEGGIIGGVVAGGLAAYDDVGKVRAGQMTAGTATVDVGVKTAVGVGAGVAGAIAGAEIGAAVGSIIPGAGTAVGLVAGAVVGGAVGYVGNALTNTDTGKAIIGDAGKAVDTAIEGVEDAGKAVEEVADSGVEAAKSVLGGLVDAVTGD